MQHKSISPSTIMALRALGAAMTTCSGRNRVCVVNYHRILATREPMLVSEPDLTTFRWQMELLASCFEVLPLSEALGRIAAGNAPPRAICITFDDGYRSIHDLALPVLREFGLPATVFVTSGYVGHGSMWNDRIIEAAQTLSDDQLDLSDFGLGTYSLRGPDARRETISLLTERSKYLPPALRQNLTERLEALVGDGLREGLMLTPEMVRKLDRCNVEIGAHTISHPILTSLDDDSARLEIAGGKQQLESILGKPVKLFAYPNGKAGKDYNERHVAMVREAGFDAAFTTAIGAIDNNLDRYQLPRSRPWDETPFLFGLRLLRWLAHA